MVDTLVLEANVERRESSSLSWGTKHILRIIAGRVRSPAWSHKPLPSLVQIQAPQPMWSRSINGDAVDCKSAVLDMPGSIPGYSTKLGNVAESGLLQQS